MKFSMENMYEEETKIYNIEVSMESEDLIVLPIH